MAGGEDFRLEGRKIWLAGHGGLAGSAILRRLQRESCDIVTVTRQELDCRNQAAVAAFVATEKPDVMIVAAATVGGIWANRTRPAEFIHDNLMIASNMIAAAAQNRVAKLVFLGSSCIYPEHAVQPIPEAALLTGSLQPDNQPYAIAKIAGIELCKAYRAQYGCNFISVMPCNLYGIGDTYTAGQSHVLPALIARAHAAKISGAESLMVWGSGKPLREFLFADDLAEAVLVCLRHYNDAMPINVGSGVEISIADLAQSVCDGVGFTGQLEFDTSKPDGTLRKVLDSSRMRTMGWQPRISLTDGIALAYDDFLRFRSTDSA